MLDVGCGEGVLTHKWAQRLRDGRIVGVDLEDPAIQAEWVKRQAPNLEYRIMKAENVSYEEARRRISDSLPARRFGLPEEFGDACAYLCSAQAGFITGQNLQLDGGSYDGLV